MNTRLLLPLCTVFALHACAVFEAPAIKGRASEESSASSAEAFTLSLATLASLTTELDYVGYETIEELVPETNLKSHYLLLEFTDPKSMLSLTDQQNSVCRHLSEVIDLQNQMASLGYSEMKLLLQGDQVVACPKTR